MKLRSRDIFFLVMINGVLAGFIVWGIIDPRIFFDLITMSVIFMCILFDILFIVILRLMSNTR